MHSHYDHQNLAKNFTSAKYIFYLHDLQIDRAKKLERWLLTTFDTDGKNIGHRISNPLFIGEERGICTWVFDESTVSAKSACAATARSAPREFRDTKADGKASRAIRIRATVLAYVAAHTHTHTSYLSAIKYSGARKTPTRSGEAKNNKQRVRTDDLHA